MKVLVVHSHYLLPGGEDAVFRQEVELLKLRNEVQEITFRNKAGWRGAVQFLCSIWDIATGAKLRKKIQTFRPDIVHIHNWHFATGPIVIRVAKAQRVPVVLTVHNFRLLCPSGILLHRGKIFTDSINARFPWKAINQKVYRGSWVLTFWLSLVVWFHKKIGTWAIVDKYIVLNEFALQVFLNSSFGIGKEKFTLKPNFVEVKNNSSYSQRKLHFLFVGRLSAEKGISVLTDALKHSDYVLHIVGDGPLKNEVLKACTENENIKYIGPLDKESVLQAMKQCSAFVFPSLCYEGMPMTILEAFATGTPVIASNLGAMKSMIKSGINGLLFEPDNTSSLKEQLDYWHKLGIEEQKIYSSNCLSEYLTNYTPEKSAAQLDSIYNDVLKKSGISV